LEQDEERTRRERPVKFFPNADPKEVEELRAWHRKKEQEMVDFFTIALSSDSETAFKDAKKIVYGEE
jgi:hypothetical protein